MNKFDEMSELLQRGKPRDLSALVQAELAEGTAANICARSIDYGARYERRTQRIKTRVGTGWG